jgi:trk system potassium uptake protein TrkH
MLLWSQRAFVPASPDRVDARLARASLMARPISARLKALRFLAPTRLLLASFAGAIALGSAALMLPGATTGRGLRFVDALFTATSATCMTGLTVLDTGTAFTRQGHWTILVLVQLGALAVMAFSITVMIVWRRPIAIRDKVIVAESSIPRASRDLVGLLKLMLGSTLLIEAVGFLLLWLFLPDRSAFSALFHSVSAFCNAGFSLYPRSLVASRYHVGVNFTIATLVVLGGLGFMTLLELYRRVRRTPGSRLSLHSRLVLAMTILLVAGGTVCFYLFESRNALRDEGFPARVLLSLFQSITARTAGFNTIELAQLTNATLFMIILLMFVGASPGSTGGGIKTSTVGILLGIARSRIRGEEAVRLFYRTIPYATVSMALSILVLGFTLVTFAVLGLAFVEIGAQPYAESDKRFIEIFFDVVSAFGAVGLSTGITSRLSDVGKCILVLVMFLGRVGPLTLAAAVGRYQARGKFRYAEEDVMVG